MNIVYEDWTCNAIWAKYDDDHALVIKVVDNSIIVAKENAEGALLESTSYASSEFMSAFSDFLERLAA
jgi:hypothetical protein